MLKRLAFFLAVIGLLVAPAMAQDRGIAFATAANGSYGACFDTDVSAAFNCALEQCVGFSGGEGCTVTLWCTPHSWTAALLITNTDGHSYFDFLCNEPTAETLEGVAAMTCAYEGYTSCEIAQVWDPDGVAQYEQQ
jgi:hypothetical protein